jgi:hypothetical protein
VIWGYKKVNKCRKQVKGFCRCYGKDTGNRLENEVKKYTMTVPFEIITKIRSEIKKSSWDCGIFTGGFIGSERRSEVFTSPL